MHLHHGQLTVEDLAFDENRAQAPASTHRQVLSAAENSPVLVKYITLLLGLLVLIAFGVRPALNRITPGTADIARKGAKVSSHHLAGRNAASVLPSAIPPEPALPDPERLRAQEILEQVSSHLKREPAQSSRLLQSWIHSE